MTMVEQEILDYYYSDINELDRIFTLNNGEVLSRSELLEKMKKNPSFDLFNEVKSFQFVGYNKLYNGKNGVTVTDIDNMIRLGLLEDYKK